MRIITLIIFILLAMPVFAQQQPSRTDLENKRKQIMDAIRETEDQLEATKKDKNATIGQLRALQNKLAERQNLIANINDEIGNINSNIVSSSTEVAKLRQDLDLQKVRYAQTLRYAYETRSSYDMLAFLFSSNDFNDAMRRMKYLKKFRDYRETQVNQIRITQGQIQHKIGVLNTEKSQKDELLTTQVQQKQVLQKETDETNNVVKDLKGREKELLADIQKNKQIVARVNRAINEVIQQEIRRAAEEQRRKEEAARKAALLAAGNNYNTNTNSNPRPRPGTTTTTIVLPKKTTKPVKPATDYKDYNLSLTPEAAALSANFESNRGKLPWPVEKGFISEPFGTHPHPVEQQVMIENYGISIHTSPNASVRAVFEGTVTKSFFIPGSGWTVMVTHGRYFTVYCGLASVSVKKDQPIHTKEAIGTVGLNDEGDPIMNFQIWKVTGNSSVRLDPAQWIAR